MKKTLGWILTILGGIMCYVSVIGILSPFFAEGISLGERIAIFVLSAMCAVGSFFVCRTGLRWKKNHPGQSEAVPQGKKRSAGEVSFEDVLDKRWMTSQLPALYLKNKDQSYYDLYVKQLEKIGFSGTDAGKIFDFECNVIRRHGKEFLLQPQFARSWLFDLKEPVFTQFPKTKAELLQETFFTVSELCKLIDEAEWHFWNSHEKAMSDAVWTEITEWRLRGPGGRFAGEYFSMIESTTGIPGESIGRLCALQGSYLSAVKWG